LESIWNPALTALNDSPNTISILIMEKRFYLVLFFPFFLFGNCMQQGREQADSVSAATARKGPPVTSYLERYMPGAMADGMVKIAVLVNQKEGDNSRQFIEGCVSEGRSMGFTVDAFVSGGDEGRCKEIAAGIVGADYDGLIFSNGFASGLFDSKDDGLADYSYDILKPFADKGIPIVTFEALPYQDGKSLNNLTTTFQDDYSLSRLSLDALLSFTNTQNSSPRVIRLGCDLGITFLDRRTWEFDQLVSDGTIQEVAFVKLSGLENPHSTAWEALASALSRLPGHHIDALWVPWDGFAGGCAEALVSAGRQEIKMVSIGVSNDDIRLMQRHSEIWLANAAVDPKLVGTVNMRMLAAKLAGETPQDAYSFKSQLLKTADLNQAVNIANLSVMVANWGDGNGLFDQYHWMIDLKGAVGKYLRIPPPPASPVMP
jgi:simple sugar transport system substrate-binding protein